VLLRALSSLPLAAAKRRDASSSVAPIENRVGVRLKSDPNAVSTAPCVLASLAFRAPEAGQEHTKEH